MIARILAAFLLAFGLLAAAVALLAWLLGGAFGWPENLLLCAAGAAVLTVPVYDLLWRR